PRPRSAAALRSPDPRRIDEVARALRSGKSALLLLGGNALAERGLRAAARCGAALAVETFPACLERGGDLPAPEKLPYFPEQVAARLADVRPLVLAAAPEPVGFFAYPDAPRRPVPQSCAVHVLAAPGEDTTAALEALADASGSTAPPSRPSAAPS